MKTVFLGIGTNLGRKEENLRQAILRINEEIGNIVRTSSLYETEPWGFATDNDFINMVVIAETELEPLSLLEKLLGIEESMGRVRNNLQYSSRIIDIDILFYENHIIDDLNLKVPHPHMNERRFVLEPLAEIAPDFIHPELKKTVIELLCSCIDKKAVRVIVSKYPAGRRPAAGNR